MTIQGLHHISLISSSAQRTVDFYVGTLGLKLVKKTVNYDDPSSYHLYFGDSVASPGSLITFSRSNAPRWVHLVSAARITSRWLSETSQSCASGSATSPTGVSK